MRINMSWREQRKGVVSQNAITGERREYISVWEAGVEMSRLHGCKMETARKEIRRAIRRGGTRYGLVWQWKEI